MPLHILIPFAVFALVMALMAVILVSIFFFCRQKQYYSTKLLDADLTGAHNMFSSSLLSIDKVEYLETIQPKLSSKQWPSRPYTEDCESQNSLVSDALMPGSSCDSVSLRSEVGTLVPNLYQKKGSVLEAESCITASQRRGKICFRVSYNFKTSDLLVRVEEARDLVLRGANPINSFIRLSVAPSVDERKRQTSTIWSTSNPSFKEEFKFPLAHERLAEYCLELQIFHRVRNEDTKLLGVVELALSLVDVTADMEVWADVAEPKSETQPDVGELLVSLNYLSSAKRLTVGIMKARDLGGANADAAVQIPDACCKVTLHVDNHVIKRKHTSTRKGTRNPEWNEAIVFHKIAPSDLPGAKLEINVVNASTLFRHSTVLGNVYIGSSCQGQGSWHWHDMKISERKNLSFWHPLVPSESQS